MILLILVVVIAVLIISKREDKVENLSKILLWLALGGFILMTTLLLIAKVRDSFTWY